MTAMSQMVHAAAASGPAGTAALTAPLLAPLAAAAVAGLVGWRRPVAWSAVAAAAHLPSATEIGSAL